MSDTETKADDIDIEVASEEDGRPQTPSSDLDLPKEKLDAIVGYLLAELAEERNAREPRVKKWIKWRRQREAISDTAARTSEEHALSNASRIEVPLTQIHAQTAYAKTKSHYPMGRSGFWQVESTSHDLEDHKDADLWTKYLKLLAMSQMDLNMAKVIRIVSDESTFMGLLMVKVVWETLEWKFKGDDGATKTMTYHDGPAIIPISQEDTHYPPYWDDVQRMPWMAHELHMPLHEFENKVAQGFYDAPKDGNGLDVDPETWLREDLNESEQKSAELRSFVPQSPGLIDLVEFHFYWDIDDDGVWEDLIFTVHEPSRTVLRKLFNGVAAREFQEFSYIPRSFQLEGRGIGQICEGLQEEASGTHRLRNDGMKLASIKMLKMRRSVMRENKSTIYQGKIWITDQPKEDIDVLAMGEVPPSSMQSENLAWSLGAQASGISSPDRGFADPTLGTRDTFRGQEMRMEQSQGIISTVNESSDEAWARVGMLVIFELVRNAKRVMWNERMLKRLSEEELTRLERMLDVDISEVPRRFRFSIYTTDIEHSYEAKRETLVKLFEITMQAQPQLVQLSQAFLGPQGMQLRQVSPDAWEQMAEIYTGSVHLLSELFHFADFADTEDYLQNVDKLDKILEMLRAQNAMQIAQVDAARARMMGGGANGASAGGSPPAAVGPAGAGPGGPQGVGPGVPGPAGQNGGVGPGAGGQ